MINKSVAALLVAFVSIIISIQVAKAEVLSCGLKSVTIKNGKIIKIRHEDGTIHTGGSVSNNWSYNGKSIKHRYMSNRTQCGLKPKSRNEVIAELSSRFIKNPSHFSMDKEEAKWMGKYTAKLMNTDKKCHLLSDAAKSTKRKDAFYIDCNDRSGNSHRYWVSRSDLKAGKSGKAMTPISEVKAINICNKELRSKATNPATYNSALLAGTTSRVVESNGRNIVEIDFSAKSAIGLENKFRGRCILEAGSLIEVTVEPAR